MASSLQESASFPPHRRNLQTIGSVAGKGGARIHRGHAANDGGVKIRSKDCVEHRKKKRFPERAMSDDQRRIRIFSCSCGSGASEGVVGLAGFTQLRPAALAA